MKIINRNKLIASLEVKDGDWLDNKITESQSLKDIYPLVNEYFWIKFSEQNYEALFQIVEIGRYDCNCDNCDCGDCASCSPFGSIQGIFWRKRRHQQFQHFLPKFKPI